MTEKTLKQMSVDVLCATSDASYCEINTPNTSNAYAELTELILIDSPDVVMGNGPMRFGQLCLLHIIETDIMNATQCWLSSNVVELTHRRHLNIEPCSHPCYQQFERDSNHASFPSPKAPSLHHLQRTWYQYQAPCLASLASLHLFLQILTQVGSVF